MYRIVVKDHIDAAHRLPGYPGKCANLHGHRWEVEVEYEVTTPSKPAVTGMVVDFADVKKVIRTFDHNTMLADTDPLVEVLRDCGVPVEIIHGPPTAENLAYTLWERMPEPDIVNTRSEWDTYRLSVRVWESPNAMAEFSNLKEFGGHE